MPNASPAFAQAMGQVTSAVQNDAAATDASGSTPPAPPASNAPAAPPADPAKAAPPVPPSQGLAAPTAAPPGTYGGQYKSEEEAIKARHVLLHSLNTAKAEIDRKEARIRELEAQSIPTPLTPGRADPSIQAQRTADPSDEKWRGVYGIDPADVDARVARIVAAELERSREPDRQRQSADAYILERYPDFATRHQDISAFVAANEPLRNRVSELWSKNLFAEAMEIGYLAYDNALRVTQAAQAVAEQTQAEVDQGRAHAGMIRSQAGGSRIANPDPNAFPRTQQEWDEIRQMKQAGQDSAVRARLFGPLIANIPELNPAR